MTGAERIADALHRCGVRRVFYFPGGTVVPLLNALIDRGIEYVCTRNEQGAGYAAIGAAKVSGKPQVVIVTSGPGATNLVTPAADAWFDSVPLLLFTGQVALKDMNLEKKVRQTGFQETDTVGLFKGITKKSVLLDGRQDIAEQVRSAHDLAASGRPGPVLIDLPMDVQLGEATAEESSAQPDPAVRNGLEGTFDQQATMEQARAALAASSRPLILAGNGVLQSSASKALRQFAANRGIPVICSLPALGAINSDHPFFFGFPGHTGEFFANLAMCYADLVIGLGARLDLRQTGTEIERFREGKTILRVDLDGAELRHGRVAGDLSYHQDIGSFLSELQSGTVGTVGKKGDESERPFAAWVRQLHSWKEEYGSERFFKDLSLSTWHVVRAVDRATQGCKVVVTSGVGGHQQLVARYFGFDYPNRQWLTSAGHGCMGYDLPAAIGATIVATSDRSAESGKQGPLGIVFAGDGSFQMNMQELGTVAERNLPLKIFVLDNGRLGVVSQFQLHNWGDDPGTGNKRNPDFAALAAAYGLHSCTVASPDDLAGSLPDVFSDHEPWLVHCRIDPEENTLPMLMGGSALNDMHPFGKVEL